MSDSSLRHLIELRDSWLLPLQELTVTRSYTYPGLILDLKGSGHSYELRIHGDAFYRDASQEEVHVPAERWNEEYPDLVVGFEGKMVEQGLAYKDGRLELHFTDASLLRVIDDSPYESWELAGSGDVHVIGLPGGELAIWDAREREE